MSLLWAIYCINDANGLLQIQNIRYQMINLINNPEYGSLQAQLEGYLTRLLEERNDPFESADYYITKWGFEVDENSAVPYEN